MCLNCFSLSLLVRCWSRSPLLTLLSGRVNYTLFWSASLMRLWFIQINLPAAVFLLWEGHWLYREAKEAVLVAPFFRSHPEMWFCHLFNNVYDPSVMAKKLFIVFRVFISIFVFPSMYQSSHHLPWGKFIRCCWGLHGLWPAAACI